MKRFFSSILVLLLLSACTPAPAARTIFAMDTAMDLQVWGKSSEENVTAVTRRIYELDRLLSVTREESEVWSLNHAGGGPVTVSEDTRSLLLSSKELGVSTGGALDTTLYPVLCAWGFTTGSYQIPDEKRLAELLQTSGYEKIYLRETDTGEMEVLLPPGMELDFGALAKGYAGEVCARLLRENGVKSALLILGGNVQTVGARPDGTPWRVLVQDPLGETGETFGTLEIVDQAVVTSGGYQRYFEEDGIRYWHILDPETGSPARSGLLSVTVVGDSGTLCDGLSTALFVMGREKALDYWRAHRDFEILLVGDDGTLTVTAGLAETFTFDESSSYTLELVEN